MELPHLFVTENCHFKMSSWHNSKRKSKVLVLRFCAHKQNYYLK